jgi:hypothetical protein
MQYQNLTRSALATAATALGAAGAMADDKPTVDTAAVDKAFEALKTFAWGVDRNVLKPIDEAVPATHGDAAARTALENRLVAVLNSNVPPAAKDFVCRKLMVIGTAASVPALAALLPDRDLSHMARYALERIAAPEAAGALRNAIPGLSDNLLSGVLGSLGVRRDAASIAAIADQLGATDVAVSAAAAAALGDIGTTEAAQALAKAPHPVKPIVADARLNCAERLLADGKKSEAKAVYEGLIADKPPKQYYLAAVSGKLKSAGK